MATATYSKKASHGLVKTVTKSGRYSATYHERRLYPKGDQRQSSLYLPTPELQAAAAAIQPPVDTAPRVLGPANQRLARYSREQAVQDRLTELNQEHARQQRGESKRVYLGRLAHAELSASGSLAAERHARKEIQRNYAQDHVQLDANIGGTDSDPLLLQDTIGDSDRLQRLAAQELEEVLVLHLTEKEVRALKLRADGLPQEDAAGYTLQRAQRKAQAALKGL